MDLGKYLTKRELHMLRKVFDAEINQRLPFQSKARTYRELKERGYIEDMTRIFGTGPFAATVTGYGLTHKGRMALIVPR